MSNTPTPRKKVTRKGAGRTKGSFCFVSLTVADMQSKIADPTFKWLVSRKQAESLGFTNLVTDRIGDLKESIAGQSEETAPKVLATEF